MLNVSLRRTVDRELSAWDLMATGRVGWWEMGRFLVVTMHRWQDLQRLRGKVDGLESVNLKACSASVR